MKPRFTNAFPDPRFAPTDAPLAVGGDLSVLRLIEAYSRGIFPWYNAGEPILWWSPDPRFVLLPRELKVSHSLHKELKKPCWEVTYDQAFAQVIRGCAQANRPGQDGTWIVEEMIRAYLELHAAGYAHSVECWHEGKLAGGLYGVSLGAAFFGESMFHRVPNASKVAFARLVERLQHWEFQLIDCQQPTKYLASFGATCWPRDIFLRTLANAVSAPTRIGKW
ncbi:MAG: leucyl/phenylalanyl-tRNA--protein transferase [Verrucomicrobiota bacterium JB024]|jgi:leucyl/phenylalanyl-tRNA--protein transferase|nr:leucyl/phenylalanyl-tRNA--protein transferase [Verrucomicrobiota bacterium JB024]